MTHSQISAVIYSIRHSFTGASQVYTMNSCYHFFLILRQIDHRALPYWHSEKRHCITRIGGRFYDINGSVQDVTGYERIPVNIEAKFGTWRFDLFTCVKQCVMDIEKAKFLFTHSGLDYDSYVILTPQQVKP